MGQMKLELRDHPRPAPIDSGEPGK
jgi:hypothetical protein